MTRPFDIVVAVDLNSGIGKNGALPWHLPGDMRHFKELTTTTESSSKKNAAIMGRKTWESLPDNLRPLPERLNVVLTRHKTFVLPDGVLRAVSLEEALLKLEGAELKDVVEKIFVIGGGEVFKEALKNSHCRKIYLTQILAKFDCDVFFPQFKKEFKETLASPHFAENSIKYYFAVYNRI